MQKKSHQQPTVPNLICDAERELIHRALVAVETVLDL